MLRSKTPTNQSNFKIFALLVTIALTCAVAYFQTDNVKRAIPNIKQLILGGKTTTKCPAVCGRGFHHSYTFSGDKVLADCFAEQECTRIEMDVAPDRSDWKMNDKPIDENHKIPVMFAIKQENLDKLEARLYEISDPNHPDYGKWLSQEEVDEMVAPRPHRIASVKSWIRSFGFDEEEIEHVTTNADYVRVHATAQQANAMLNGVFHEFTHAPTGKKLIRLRDDSYSLPDFIAEHVDMVTPNARFHLIHRVGQDTAIQPLEDLSQLHPVIKKDDEYSSIPTLKTPDVLNHIYSLPNGHEYPGAQPGQKQAFLELIGGRYSERSVKEMEEHYHVRKTKLDRFPANQGAGTTSESILDGTCMAISSSGVETVGFEPGHQHFFLHFCLELRAMHPSVRPQVASISYSSDEQADGKTYVTRSNYEFMKLTAQGITFLASSGDYGVKGIKGKCWKGGQFVPSYPASSPFVVGVGGSEGGVMNPKNTREDAWSGSGGGFSVWLARPKYQEKSLSKYWTKSKFSADSKKVNAAGSGYPDIAAASGTYPIWVSGLASMGGGTSASSPFIGGVFSLLNAYRLKQGKPVLGFVNPLLYHLSDLDQVKGDSDTKFFHDVTTGSTDGCLGSSHGFNAMPGWDPTTGVGTPNVRAIKEYLDKHH